MSYHRHSPLPGSIGLLGAARVLWPAVQEAEEAWSTNPGCTIHHLDLWTVAGVGELSQRQLARLPSVPGHFISDLGLPEDSCSAARCGFTPSFPLARPRDPGQPRSRDRNNEHPGALSVHKDGSLSLSNGISKDCSFLRGQNINYGFKSITSCPLESKRLTNPG